MALTKTEQKILTVVTQLFKIPPAERAAQALNAIGITSQQVNDFKQMADPYRIAIVNAMRDIEKKDKKNDV